MPTVEPFAALRPTTGASALAPPYDVIDASQRTRLQADSPHNVTHLTLPDGPESAKYMHAAGALRAWGADGSLELDGVPSFTIYEQTSAGDHALRGVFAAVGLAEPADGGVLPHERTYDTVVQDRLALLSATACNLEPVFLLAYGAPSITALIDAACQQTPLLDVDALGVHHRAWRVDDRATIDAMRATLGGAALVIADGHHRWRTAQRYAQQHAADPAAGAHLAFIADAASGGVELRPIHRALPGVTASAFAAAIDGVASADPVAVEGPDALADVVTQRRASARVFGLWSGGRGYLVTMRDPAPLPGPQTLAWRDLDVAVLHQALLCDLGDAQFAHSPRDAAARAGDDGCAILLASPPIAAVRAIAEAGEAMPQKSTFFVPKPASGIVLRPLHP